MQFFFNQLKNLNRTSLPARGWRVVLPLLLSSSMWGGTALLGNQTAQAAPTRKDWCGTVWSIENLNTLAWINPATGLTTATPGPTTQITMPNLVGTSVAAIGIHKESGTMYAFDRNGITGTLYKYKFGVDTTWQVVSVTGLVGLTGSPISGTTSNLNKMTVDGNTLFITDSSAIAVYAIPLNAAGTVIGAATVSRYSFVGVPAGTPTLSGGDITTDEYGDTYNVTYDSVNGAYFFVQDPVAKTWVYQGFSASGSLQFAGAAFYKGNLYVKGGVQLYRVNLTRSGSGYTGWNNPLIAVGSASTTSSADLTSCGNPNLIVTKTQQFYTDAAATILAANQTKVRQGQYIKYIITVKNTGDAWSRTSNLGDNLPIGTSYVPNSATLNGANLGIASYPTTGFPLNSTGSSSGIIPFTPDPDTATLTFVVNVTATSGTIQNRATVTYVDATGLPSEPADCTNALNCGETPITPIDNSVTLSGTVFEDVNYGGGAGRDFTTSGSNGRQNARVELYSSAGAFISATTTDASGNYSFSVSPSTAYTVRVVNSTVTSSRAGYVNTLVPVQTFRTDGLTANVGTADLNRVGGETPQLPDAGNGSTTLAALTTTTTTAQSITPVTLGTAGVTGINFGYNFDTIVNTNNTGQGSLRQFITNSNALTNIGLAQQGLTIGQETSIFMIPDGAAHPGVRAGLTNQVAGTGGNANAAVINLASTLNITDANTSLDATTQTSNIGNSNSGIVGTGGTVGVDNLPLSTIPRPEVVLNFQAIPNNTNAILVGGANTVLKGFASYGYRSNNNLGTLLNAAIVIQSSVTNAGPATITQLLGGTLADGSNPGVPTATIGHTFQTAGSANISNNYLAYNADAISFENTNGTSVNFINNELADNGPKDNNTSNVSGIYSDQMETVANTRNITVRGNLVRNSSKPGFASAQGQGFQITYSTFITVENNTFSDNNVYAINAASSDTLIQKNIITGTKNTGLGQGIGVAVFYGNGTGLRNRISQNSIYQNAKLGIDHLVNGTNIGVNPNDGTVDSALANNGIDYPIMTSSTLSGGILTVKGYVGNAAGGSSTFANATLEFFLADDDGNNNGKVFTSDPGSVSQPHGEGKTYLSTLTTDGSGNFSGNLTVPAGVTVKLGDSLTATATDSVGNTSEFSANAVVTLPVASNPKLILVKRITAINSDAITTVVNPFLTPDPNDESPNWPVGYLKGATDAGIVKNGDELEYTIYFLSSGDVPITKVNVCDLVPANSTFIPTAYNGLSPTDGGLLGADSGIALTIGPSPFYLSNVKDTDRGEFFLAGTTPGGACSGTNDNGAVVVNIVTGANTLPNSTAPGTPTNSYGFIRFRARVN
jgi:trimeric autotransporter adhesin